MGVPFVEAEKPCCEAVERYCEKHGSFKAKRAVVFGKEFFSTCPLCDGEQAAADEAEKNAKSADEKALQFARMNIEPEFYGASLENYRAETESQMAALEAVRGMVAARRGSVALSGGFGIGKTRLACAAAKELGGAVYTMFEIALRIRCTYAPKAAETELDALKELGSLPFLAIDEIGRSKGAEAEANWLSYIIDKRHARFLPTMLLSNRPLERSLPKERAQWSLESFLDSDIVPRFRSGAVVEIEGADWRSRRN